MRKVSNKIIDKIKLKSYVQELFSENCTVYDNMQKYGRGKQATEDNIIWRMRFECRVTKARIQTHTQSM